MVNQKAVSAYQYGQSSQFHHDSWDIEYLFLKNLAPVFVILHSSGLILKGFYPMKLLRNI